METEKKQIYFQFYYINSLGEHTDYGKIISTNADEKTLRRLEKMLIDANLKPCDRADKFIKILKELGYYCEEVNCNRICLSTGN